MDRKKADKAETIRPAREGRRRLLATGLAVAVVAAAVVGYWAYRAAADLPGVKLADQGNAHIQLATEPHVPYNSDPPTSGPAPAVHRAVGHPHRADRARAAGPQPGGRRRDGAVSLRHAVPRPGGQADRDRAAVRHAGDPGALSRGCARASRSPRGRGSTPSTTSTRPASCASSARIAGSTITKGRMMRMTRPSRRDVAAFAHGHRGRPSRWSRWPGARARSSRRSRRRPTATRRPRATTRTWRALVRALAGENVPLRVVAKDSGVISTDDFISPIGVYADCGRIGEVQLEGEALVLFTLFVQPGRDGATRDPGQLQDAHARLPARRLRQAQDRSRVPVRLHRALGGEPARHRPPAREGVVAMPPRLARADQARPPPGARARPPRAGAGARVERARCAARGSRRAIWTSCGPASPRTRCAAPARARGGRERRGHPARGARGHRAGQGARGDRACRGR